MRHHFLYIIGLCLITPFAADAAGLPANPWLQNTNRNIVQTNRNQNVNSDISESKAAELTEKLNNQMENYGNMLQQATDEAKTEAATKAQEIENVPSWHEIMDQVTPENSDEDAAQQQQETTSGSIDPAGIVEISRAISDAQAQYNRAKNTTGAYYNKAKNKLKQLEYEAQNSVNEVQKMLKK